LGQLIIPIASWSFLYDNWGSGGARKNKNQMSYKNYIVININRKIYHKKIKLLTLSWMDEEG